jgi:hypothetical protein
MAPPHETFSAKKIALRAKNFQQKKSHSAQKIFGKKNRTPREKISSKSISKLKKKVAPPVAK